MTCRSMLLTLILLSCAALQVMAQSTPQPESPQKIDPASVEQPVMETITQPGVVATADTLARQWTELCDSLAENGIELGFGVTQVYQQNLHGGLSTQRRSGRYAGSYDLEIGLDLQKIAAIDNAAVYILAEGSWSEGLNPSSVGALAEVNADASDYRSIDVAEFWYQQSFADDSLVARIGKLDLSTTFEHQNRSLAFDGNRYANDEVGQFINLALVNNLSIPFPDRGLGAMLMYRSERFYLAAGGLDAHGDTRETGFSTAFHGPDNFFGIIETGLMADLPSPQGDLPGTYRIGFWYDPQPKTHFVTGRTVRDDRGLYLSFDQMFYRESPDDDDSQGLGGFFRYGLADGDVNDIHTFWSLGLAYDGLLPGRDEDTLGAAMAQSRLSRAAGYTADHETVMEVYYNARIRPWLYVAPHLQYIHNPGGASNLKPATVIGLRIQFAF